MGNKKRKIIEIFITENKEDNSISFDIEKKEESKIANYTMGMLLSCFGRYKKEEDTLEVQYGEILEKN